MINRVYGVEKLLTDRDERERKSQHPGEVRVNARLHDVDPLKFTEWFNVSAPESYRAYVTAFNRDVNEIEVELYYVAVGAWPADVQRQIIDRFDGERIGNHVRRNLCDHRMSTADCTLTSDDKQLVKKTALLDLDERLRHRQEL